MKRALFILLCIGMTSQAQNISTKSEKWTSFNREATFDQEIIHLNANEKDGILWLNDAVFKNGTIELDIRGKDERGKSFVGIVFHGQDDETFDGIYFRAFNFQSPERKTHAVQYISKPDNDWSVLRKAFPDKYENSVNPVPNPNEWFHAKIVVNYPLVKVYVNGSKNPSLEIEQISSRKQGKFGLWVGNGSEGYFRNVKISSN
jgi:hypothetical protein